MKLTQIDKQNFMSGNLEWFGPNGIQNLWDQLDHVKLRDEINSLLKSFPQEDDYDSPCSKIIRDMLEGLLRTMNE